MKHLIVAGHGQGKNKFDPGAVCGEYREADLVRKYLIESMKKYSGDSITYVVDKNVYDYKCILDYRNGFNITEIHFNASNNPSARGTEVLIHEKIAPSQIDKNILLMLGEYFFNRGIKKRNDLYNMNACYKNSINYRLVEVCFITNENDVEIFMENLEAIASGLVLSIVGKIYDPSFKIRVVVPELNVRYGPGVEYEIGTTVKEGEVYTIVEEKNGWGRLKSGVGWIKLSFTERID